MNFLSFVRHTPQNELRANDISNFVPEIWAQRGLMEFEANLIAANLVHRDYSDEIKTHGEVVSIVNPGSFVAKRKGHEDVTVQNLSSTKVQVALNQWLHTSFVVKDDELAKSFTDLVATYLTPAMRSLAQTLDETILTQCYHFPKVGKLNTTATKSLLIDAKTQLDSYSVPGEGRNLILTPSTENDLLNIDNFITADKVGDEGSAMREGSLGRKFGFQIFGSLNAPTIPLGGNDVVEVSVNNSAGYAAGSTSIVINDTAGDPTVGCWLTIEGDMQPQFVTAYNDTTKAMTISPGLKYDVKNNAVVTIYTPAAINFKDGYDVDHYLPIAYDGLTEAPKKGQMLTLGVTTTTLKRYAAIGSPTTTSAVLDIPLVAAAADNAVLGVGPAGNYNFAFNRNAIALVSRPLPTPPAGTGAASFVATYNGLAMRVTITYNGVSQGMLVTCDLLFGVKPLNTNYGVQLLA